MEKKAKPQYKNLSVETRLKDLREDKDLKQKEIANILGIDQRQYSLYERGIRSLLLNQLITLAEFYNTSIDYILYRTDERKPYPKSIMNE